MRKIIFSILFLLPTLTFAHTYGNNILTGGTCSADSSYTTNTCDKAQDGNTATPWTSALSSPPHWWKYDLGSGVTKQPAKIYLQLYESTGNGNSVKSFILQGSSDNSTWNDIFSTTTINGPDESNQAYYYTFDNTTSSYRYWRYDMEDSNRASGFVEIYETELYECTDCTSSSSTTSTSSLLMSTTTDLIVGNVFELLYLILISGVGLLVGYIIYKIIR